MTFKSSYHLQPCQLPKLDAEGPSVGGYDSKMAFKSSYHLQPCWLPKLDAGGASVGGHDSNMAFKSSLQQIVTLAMKGFVAQV